MIKVEIKEEYIEENDYQYQPIVIPDESIERCGNCVACFRVTNCGKCPNCEQRIQPCFKRICIRNGLNNKSYLPNEPSSSTIIISNDQPDIFSELQKDADEANKPKRKPYTKRNKEPVAKRRKGFKDEEYEDDLVENGEEFNDENGELQINRKPHKVHKPHVWQPKEIRAAKRNESEELFQRQCYGPFCVKVARKGSKYCSNECGHKLAEHRLKYILQARVNDFYKLIPDAEKTDDKRILMLNLKKAAVERKLELANRFSSTIDVYLYQLFGLISDNKHPSNSSKSGPKTSIFCILCNSDISMQEYQTHINSCSAKVQRNFYYGSKYPLGKNSYDIVCNEYIPNANAYCRRLRFACTEHLNVNTKTKICGYPMKLARNIRIEELFSMNFEYLTSDGVCTKKHKACHSHLQWEVNLRAILDNHRMNLLLCLDEISIEYHRLQETYRTRGDALTLLSNWRKLSEEEAKKEEINYRVAQMTAVTNPSDYMVLKQE